MTGSIVSKHGLVEHGLICKVSKDTLQTFAHSEQVFLIRESLQMIETALKTKRLDFTNMQETVAQGPGMA